MPGVILQGHLDMVCQVNSGTQHDFERDPINTIVRDGWVIAKKPRWGRIRYRRGARAGALESRA